MLSGATLRASEIAGTAVFKIVVSSDSIKNATATSHGKSRLLEVDGAKGTEGAVMELSGAISFVRCKYFTKVSADASGAAKLFFSEKNYSALQARKFLFL
jgi:hypothetical protein